MAFLDHLVQKGEIDQNTAERVAQEAQRSGVDATELLIERGLDKERILNLKAEYLDIPYRSVNPEDVSLDVLKFIPEESAVHYQIVPIGKSDDALEVGIVDPDNLEARDALQFISTKAGMPFKLYLISKADYEALLENYKSLSGEVHKALSELETELGAEEKSSKKGEPSKLTVTKEDTESTRIIEETPVTKIVAVILRHAVEGNASDIHIEHTGEKVRVRFRVAGDLYTSLFLPIAVHNGIVARVKVLANLKLDEKRKPQDGSFPATIDKRKIDLRVSTFPAYYGEKVVMRILDPEKGIKTLDETGLREADLEKVRKAVTRPYGLILLTGPTGSGKTTSLYSMLHEIDRERQNVVSLEDPVEYNIDGVSQSQVRPEIGYTFANGLRSIVRQDPDVIMVGEIRDKETAGLAIQAALTGHLVFSTLHTNNAAGVVPRLVNMGVDPYLIAPTLNLAVAQRLVPALCEEAEAKPIEGKIREDYEQQFADLPEQYRGQLPEFREVYEPKASSECPSGTRGRVGVFELLTVDDEMQQLLMQQPKESEIMELARQKGMITMKEDAMIKASHGMLPYQAVGQFEG